MSKAGPFSLSNILPGVEMPDFQRKGIESVFINKKMLLAFDTGTGKTFTYAGIVRGLLNRNPEKKHLLIIINDSIEQVPKDVRSLTSVNVFACGGTADSIHRLKTQWHHNSIFCLTLEAFRQEQIIHFLFKRLPEIESIVIDEAHHVSNWTQSDTAFMIRCFTQYVPYVVELSATPMTRESKQYYRLMNLLDRNMSHKRNETYLGKYVDRYMPVNRGDYDMKGDYTPTLIPVKPTMDQISKQHGIVFKKIKGWGAKPQAEALVKAIKSRLSEGKRQIVYVHYHNTREWIEHNLELEGIKYVSLHGRITKREERQEILETYKSGEVDVLITSVTESLNINADVVIFYEFTTLVKQVIGRAHRGLSGKPLEIVFIITVDTDEVEFFMKYIYDRSITIQNLLRKDYSEILSIGEQLKSMSLNDD